MITIDSAHHESDLRSVGGASEMCVYLLGLGLVESDESVQNVVACRSIVWTALICC